MNIEQAIAYLNENLPERIDMLEALRRKSAKVISCGKTHCLIQSTDTELIQLACDASKAGIGALLSVEKPRLIVAHGKQAYEAVKTVWPEYGCDKPCHQAYYPGIKQEDGMSACEIRPFPKEAIEVILAHYDNITDPAYMLDRIEKGDMFAGFADGQICGFIGFHRDGSMGMLEVFPSFRHRHIGFALERDLINRALDRGWIPYCHIYEGNTASVRLQKKLELSVTEDCPVFWMRKKKKKEDGERTNG